MKKSAVKPILAGTAALAVLLCGITAAGPGSHEGRAHAEAAANACTPYGPWEGAAYNPAKLMKMLGQPRTDEIGPFLSAHRGAWGTDQGLPKPAPENSIAAIDNAAALKFEMVELDVKLTSDGKLVLMHDYTMGRMTDYAESQGIGFWNPFLGETHDGYRPQDHGDWGTMARYNPLVNQLSGGTAAGTKLLLFDKNAGYLGTMDGADAIGRWDTGDYGKVPTLLEALTHIGKNYPGMTVVIDLRHLDEVKEAMKVISNVTDCMGRPGNEWVILKPFANVFKGGLINANVPGSTVPDPQSVSALIGPSYYVNKWIPVVSNRLVPPNPKGEPSVIPGSPGPDTSQIIPNVTQYLRDWGRGLGRPVVTFEIGAGDHSIQSIKDAYNSFSGQVTNMESWRPPDINVSAPVVDPSNNRTIIGFNWKDDGTGVYPVYKETSRSYEDTKKWAGALTIEDPLYVLNAEVFTRKAAQMAISDATNFQTFKEYAIIGAASGKALDVAAGASADGTAVTIWQLSKLDNQLWSILPNGDGTVRLQNPFTGKSLDLTGNNSASGTAVELWSNNTSGAQRWKLAANDDGTYRIVHAESGKVLDVDSNGSANGTKVQIWDSNGYAHQKWWIIPVQTFRLQQKGSPELMMGTPNASAYAGTPLKLGSLFTSVVRWRPLNQKDGGFRLVQIHPARSYIQHGAVLLDTKSKGTAEGTLLQTASPDGTPTQSWGLVYNKGDGTYMIRNPQSGRVADVSGGSPVPNADIILFRAHGNTNQRWFIKPE